MSSPVKKSMVKPVMRMAELVYDNPALLLLMENLEMDFLLHDYTVSETCRNNRLREPLFLLLANLYNGHKPTQAEVELLIPEDLPVVIRFLKKSHHCYKEEHYPYIRDLITEMNQLNHREEVRMVEAFFDTYFEEVLEHLNYEDEVAFPYICSLLKEEDQNDETFCVKEYQEHHSDIESKLSDLKSLLLKHITIDQDRQVRRRLLKALSELEADLVIHSLIEELILMPVVARIERSRNHGS
jgi:regulator of cell morphogenesis and NO signaling